MVTSLAELALMPLLYQKKNNTFWEEGRLAHESQFRQHLQTLIWSYGLDNEEHDINAVYLFGSVLSLRHKSHYLRPPSDMDLWITYRYPSADNLEDHQAYLRRIHAAFSHLPTLNNLPYHLQISDTRYGAPGELVDSVIEGYQIYPYSERPLVPFR